MRYGPNKLQPIRDPAILSKTWELNDGPRTRMDPTMIKPLVQRSRQCQKPLQTALCTDFPNPVNIHVVITSPSIMHGLGHMYHHWNHFWIESVSSVRINHVSHYFYELMFIFFIGICCHEVSYFVLTTSNMYMTELAD